MKFNLISAFNNHDQGLNDGSISDTEFDTGVACDLLLDLLRYEEQIILNPQQIKLQFDHAMAQGLVLDANYIEQ
jgi:hypothetical protein